VLAFAGRRRLPLIVVDDDHRLTDSLDRIVEQFGLFLAGLSA
jgi:hypothetical protein